MKNRYHKPSRDREKFAIFSIKYITLSQCDGYRHYMNKPRLYVDVDVMAALKAFLKELIKSPNQRKE